MKRTFSIILALVLSASLATSAFASGSPMGARRSGSHGERRSKGVGVLFVAGQKERQTDFAALCYPTSVTRSADGSEIRKIYELAPNEDPSGILRTDFERDGFHYTLTDLLRQEAPEHEERIHTETVSLPSQSGEMQTVLAMLDEEREFTTEDGLSGTLVLNLDSVQVAPAGYGSAAREISATRTYPNLANQDTAYIQKTIEEGGKTLTLQSIQWQEDGGHFTACAVYTGTTTDRYVTGYTVTADYVGIVSRFVLDQVRYVAIFSGTPLVPDEPEPEPEPEPAPIPEPELPFRWALVLVPLGVIALAGAGAGVALFLRRRSEIDDEEEDS